MAYGLISAWKIGGETMETVTDFIFWSSKITADCDCSHEIKRRLLLGRKSMTKQHIKNQRHHLVDKGSQSQSYGFPVVMYRYESLAINKDEHQRIDYFKLWFWRRFLRVPWTAKRSSQSTIKEINPEYSFEGLMLKLKLQYFGLLM